MRHHIAGTEAELAIAATAELQYASKLDLHLLCCIWPISLYEIYWRNWTTVLAVLYSHRVLPVW